MKLTRLSLLMGILGLVALWRIFGDSSEAAKIPVIAEAIVREPRPSVSGVRTASTPEIAANSANAIPTVAPTDTLSSRAWGDIPGNAFGIRPPPLPPPAPPPPKPVAVALPPPAAPVVAPPPPVPYVAIGTWDDGKVMGVFLASAYGTLLALPGMVLPENYQVAEITPGHIALLHLPSKREARLNVPSAPNTTRY